MYSRCGVLAYGIKVFDEMPETNLVSWTLIISAAVQSGEFKLALDVYLEMTRNGLRPNEFAVGSVMKVCGCMGATDLGLSFHGFALKIGIETNPFGGCSILNFYAKLGNIEGAEQMFDCINSVDTGCWNAMIGAYAQCGFGFEALKFVSSMRCKGINMDKYTFINALQGCSVVGDLNTGKQMHGLIIRNEEECSISVMNALMDMYIKNGEMDSAFKIFKRISNKDVVSWNSLFGGFSEYDNLREIAELFHEFLLSGIRPSHVTFSVLFRQCGEVHDLKFGLQLYCLALHFGFLHETNVTSSLIYMFCRCGVVEMARLVFDNVLYKNITIWNELISGYNFNSCDMEVVKTFCSLWKSGFEVNEFTFFCTLEACCRSENQQMGRQIHGVVIKSGFSHSGYVCSSLIKSYVKFGQLDDSFEFFNGLERLDTASWATMISTLVHQGYNYDALRFFHYLIESAEQLDEYILGSILNSCADTGVYQQTRSIHPFIIKLGFDADVFVASAVIDAYAKCGDIKGAKMAFDQSFKSTDVIIYNSLIMAYAQHGLVKEAMEIFDKMKLANLKPSQATFVSVLSACSHKGLVKQGCLLFKSMTLQYGVEPSPDNYGCLVDMLSRNGYLEDAEHVIEVMPFPPWPAVYRSLISGCGIHGNRELGERTAKKLLQLLPQNDSAYVLLSKVYSEGGSWEGAAKVRRGMTEKQILKGPGYSWIETLNP
ncbi:hypothetical protein Patl1_16402 [Pistacia atlantica]|uniref:Uncharacterized protein n=1 Tax=Pistacia atlantica TaxID=434234 RepID=A0ACC1B823_9ROSI|nr:hypothetical protein Patl1_16402 [Pistacia atlantica]